MNNSTFTQREMSEIELALFYVMRCKHGMDGHGRLMLIAKMAQRMGIVMDSNAKMIVPGDVAVEPYDLGPATARDFTYSTALDNVIFTKNDVEMPETIGEALDRLRDANRESMEILTSDTDVEEPTINMTLAKAKGTGTV